MNKKELGAKKAQEREKAKLVLASLKGKRINTMSKSEQEALLIAICQILGIADETNTIK